LVIVSFAPEGIIAASGGSLWLIKTLFLCHSQSHQYKPPVNGLTSYLSDRQKAVWPRNQRIFDLPNHIFNRHLDKSIENRPDFLSAFDRPRQSLGEAGSNQHIFGPLTNTKEESHES